MIPCEPGEVLLVRFPFTDLSSAKKRPVVAVSRPEFSARHGDVVVMALTGRDQGEEALRLEDWREAGLLKPTWIKPLVATLAAEVFDLRLGRLSARDGARLAAVVDSVIAREF